MTKRGGLLSRLALPFRFGLGARLGTGKQYWPVVSLADEVAALRRMIDDEALSGPVNVVCPQVLTNAEVSAALAAALHRPAWLAVPRPLLNLTAQTREMLLYGQRVRPAALERVGFEFAHPTVESVLRWALAN
jgi:NAD dependent epimerase/dehydratase family enzyme